MFDGESSLSEDVSDGVVKGDEVSDDWALKGLLLSGNGVDVRLESCLTGASPRAMGGFSIGEKAGPDLSESSELLLLDGVTEECRDGSSSCEDDCSSRGLMGTSS